VTMETAGVGHCCEQSLEYSPDLHSAHRQRGVNLLQLGVLSVVMASAPQSPAEQDFVSASQIRPLSDVQSSSKQEQAAVLGNSPPVLVHCS